LSGGTGPLIRAARELGIMVRRHRWYLLTPILVMLALIALLLLWLGPRALVAFIYAGA
jgi:hypothetical protein